MKDPAKVKQGKKNKAQGGLFELQTRKDLEKKGWIVDKFSNNIDLINSCFIKAGNKYIPRKGLMPGAGFPDFIIFNQPARNSLYDIQFVECKINGTLSREEKLKMEWLHGEGFICWVASKEGKLVEYKKPLKVRRKNTKY